MRATHHSISLLSAYHSKYNPVERTLGWREQHWRGSLLDSVETVIGFAESLTFKGHYPTVKGYVCN